MTDPVDQFFEREREAVPTLSPPPGLFDELQRVARRKRNRNTTMVSAAAAVVLAVAGTGAVIGAQNHGSAPAALTPAGPTAKVSVSASARPTVTSTVVPVDAAVPADFTAWSVTFVSPSHGWALGGYSCGDQQCVAVLETTDAMASWHTLAKPATATSYGVSAGHATLRFQNAMNGWIVGRQGVYSTHDGGLSWHAVAALASAHIDALEAWRQEVYAVGVDGAQLWVNADPGSDGWSPEAGLGLPTATAATVDSLVPEDHALAAVRTTGLTTTVRYSSDDGVSWQTVSAPCSDARLFTVLQANVGRFICGNGQLWGIHVDGSMAPLRDATFKLHSTTGKKVVAESITQSASGTVIAYQGAGLQGLLSNGSKNSAPTAGDFRYVGMTTNAQGIALPMSLVNAYWYTTNGGQTWHRRSFG